MPPAKPEDTKPVEDAAAQAEPPAERPRRSAAIAAVQPVTILTSPSGATATLDGRPDATCRTPCTMDATPGRHAISVTMPGHEVEYREITVGSGPLEMPVVVLRAHGGTLMLTSTPPGATILINGRRLNQVTPAQIPLSPGTYSITVEKDGRQSTQKVDIRNGAMTLQRFILPQ
jgi:hypothetical protein